MSEKLAIIGAGIVGIATASYLRRDGHDVTVVDMRPPGEYCSSGNAGILSPGSCVPIAMPGILGKVPGYLMNPLGPLKVRWSYYPWALPWLPPVERPRPAGSLRHEPWSSQRLSRRREQYPLPCRR